MTNGGYHSNICNVIADTGKESRKPEIDYSEDIRTVNTYYLFVLFFSDHRMRTRHFDKRIYCFPAGFILPRRERPLLAGKFSVFTLFKMLTLHILRRAFIP